MTNKNINAYAFCERLSVFTQSKCQSAYSAKYESSTMVSQTKLHPTLTPHKSSSTQWKRLLLISSFRANVSTNACKVLAQNNEYILRYCF